MPPKGWVFSISESWKILIGHEKVMEKSLNFIAQFLYEPCRRIQQYDIMWHVWLLTELKMNKNENNFIKSVTTQFASHTLSTPGKKQLKLHV